MPFAQGGLSPALGASLLLTLKEVRLMGKQNIGTFIWRGAVGGAVGNLLFLLYGALSYKFTLGHIPYPQLFILAIPMYLVIGAAIGAVIGIIIWGCLIKSGRNIGAVVRACIGMGSVIIIGLLMSLISKEDSRGLVPPSLAYRIVTGILAVLVLGALPGLVARPNAKQSDSS